MSTRDDYKRWEKERKRKIRERFEYENISNIIDMKRKISSSNPATEKQIYTLKSLGYEWDTTKLSKGSASSLIQKLMNELNNSKR